MSRFPKDKDLPAGSLMVATVLDSERVETAPASQIGALLKQLRMEQAESCDMVILCVAPGRGKLFVQGLMESIASDPTAVIDPT